MHFCYYYVWHSYWVPPPPPINEDAPISPTTHPPVQGVSLSLALSLSLSLSLSLRPLQPLPDSPGDATSSPLKLPVALGISPARTETETNRRRPGTAFEKQDREHNAETSTEGGLDDEVGKALIPLKKRLVSPGNAKYSIDNHTFSLSKSSDAGRFFWTVSVGVAVIVGLLEPLTVHSIPNCQGIGWVCTKLWAPVRLTVWNSWLRASGGNDRFVVSCRRGFFFTAKSSSDVSKVMFGHPGYYFFLNFFFWSNTQQNMFFFFK